MALPLFSQIPTQVLTKLGKENVKKTAQIAKFYADDSQEAKEIDTESDIEVVNDGKSNTRTLDVKEDPTIVDTKNSFDRPAKKKVKYSDECTSSNNQLLEKTFSDAIVQTDDQDIFKRDACVQTIETSFNRLRKSDYEVHREQGNNHFGDAYKPMYSLPKRQGKDAPPLKIGLTLRGRKRKVYYPGLDEE